ncbi:myeloid leukemia factor [Chironomus tepperi]|uniref:myeloid leukemia factor n=1 Tax=Chironomus tepperi TaxID=113505 RepID=UPI00391EEB6D
MSLSNFFFGDLEDDPIFGHQMRQMRQITNSLFNHDPFNMFGMPSIGGNMGLIPSSRFAPMPTMNRLLASPFQMGPSSSSYSTSSSVFCMSSDGSGQPQVYKETSSVRTGPDGVKETRRTVEDSTSGTRKMAIGHHIGERSRILEKEQNVRTGQREEREELINLEESDTEDFERDFEQKARSNYSNRRHHLQIEEIGTEPLPAIQSVEDYHRNRVGSPRRAIRSSPLALPSASSRSHNESSLLHPHPHPYSSTTSSRKHQMKSSNSSSSSSRKIKGHLNHH